EANTQSYPVQCEKNLRVLRMVRDHVLTVMSDEERIEITKAVATLYFGSDWRLGTVRMRRRIAFTNEISSHRSGNEMTILRSLASRPERYFDSSMSSVYTLGISYIGQLKSKGFYGEAYEAARDFLGSASSNDCSTTDRELRTLLVLAGGCARMTGEREACIE